jgi:hypothetical protein
MTIEEKRRAIKDYCGSRSCTNSCPLHRHNCDTEGVSDAHIEMLYDKIFDENGRIRPEALIPIDSPTETVNKTTETVNKTTETVGKSRSIEEMRRMIENECHRYSCSTCPLKNRRYCYCEEATDAEIEVNYIMMFGDNKQIDASENAESVGESVDKSLSNAEKKRAIEEYCKGTFCEDCPLFNGGNLCGSESVDYNYAVLFESQKPVPKKSTHLKPSGIHDAVNHPAHYADGKIEPIDYILDKKLDFCLGNAVKYISRAGKKNPDKFVEDLRKAIWYIERRIEEHERGVES